MLHITNGDATAKTLNDADLGGEIAVWRDVLHEGPVPAGLGLDELREVRARYLAGEGWATYERVLADLTARDALLRDFDRHPQIVLWFEHDLYDQLQVLQALDFFSSVDVGGIALEAIGVEDWVAKPGFHGLGQLSPQELALLWNDSRHAVTADALRLGRDGWAAFRDPDPRVLERFSQTDTSALPFLASALRRHFEEYPSTRDGLSRTEAQILSGIATGIDSPPRLFADSIDREEAPYLGDSVYWSYLQRLAAGPRPLLAITEPSPEAPFVASTLTLTDDGRGVLAGEADHIRCNGIDRWLGGVHLTLERLWRWDDVEVRRS
jgi:hypothetical protein